MIAAVITASVAVIVAVGTQVWTSVRSRTDRQYASRRAGLIDAQDAMLDLRAALEAFGVGLRSAQVPLTVAEPPLSPADDPILAQDDHESNRQIATGRFLTCVARVHDDAVVTAMTDWRTAAERRFISVEEVTASTEADWFEYVQALCRAALMSSTGIAKRRDRSKLASPPPLTGG